MRVLVVGATGFIGRALVPVLQREGHSVGAWTRSPARARSRLGAGVEILAVDDGLHALTAAIERSDAVVNLAGEALMGGRWTAKRRHVLRDSRVGVTGRVVDAIRAARRRPGVFVSGSAVGYYGNRGDDLLAEDAVQGRDFLATLCGDWEAAARGAEACDVRVVSLRTGVVLGRGGGALSPMLLPFRLGLGGPVGTGRQYLSWIHLHDLVTLIAALLVNDRYRGPVNGVAPAPVTNRDFARALGRALRRPAVLPVPSLALRLIFGEAASVLLDSQRVDPAVVRATGFAFAFPTLEAALADIFGGPKAGGARLSGGGGAPEDEHRGATATRGAVGPREA